MATPEISKEIRYQLILPGFQPCFRDEHKDLSLSPEVLGIDADAAQSLSESPPSPQGNRIARRITTLGGKEKEAVTWLPNPSEIPNPSVRLRVIAHGNGLRAQMGNTNWQTVDCLLAEAPPVPEEQEPHTISSGKTLSLVDFQRLSNLRSLLDWRLWANPRAYHFERPEFNQVLNKISEVLIKQPPDKIIDTEKKWPVSRSVNMSLDTILSQLAIIEFVVAYGDLETDTVLRQHSIRFFKIFHDRIRPQREITNLQALSLLSLFTGENGFKITSLYSQYSAAREILLQSFKKS